MAKYLKTIRQKASGLRKRAKSHQEICGNDIADLVDQDLLAGETTHRFEARVFDDDYLVVRRLQCADSSDAKFRVLSRKRSTSVPTLSHAPCTFQRQDAQKPTLGPTGGRMAVCSGSDCQNPNTDSVCTSSRKELNVYEEPEGENKYGRSLNELGTRDNGGTGQIVSCGLASVRKTCGTTSDEKQSIPCSTSTAGQVEWTKDSDSFPSLCERTSGTVTRTPVTDDTRTRSGVFSPSCTPTESGYPIDDWGYGDLGFPTLDMRKLLAPSLVAADSDFDSTLDLTSAGQVKEDLGVEAADINPTKQHPGGQLHQTEQRTCSDISTGDESFSDNASCKSRSQLAQASVQINACEQAAAAACAGNTSTAALTLRQQHSVGLLGEILTALDAGRKASVFAVRDRAELHAVMLEQIQQSAVRDTLSRGGHLVVVMQDYSPFCNSQEEMGARRGEILEHVVTDGRWSLLRKGDGREGFIPACYCQPLTNIDLDRADDNSSLPPIITPMAPYNFGASHHGVGDPGSTGAESHGQHQTLQHEDVFAPFTFETSEEESGDDCERLAGNIPPASCHQFEYDNDGCVRWGHATATGCHRANHHDGPEHLIANGLRPHGGIDDLHMGNRGRSMLGNAVRNAGAEEETSRDSIENRSQRYSPQTRQECANCHYQQDNSAAHASMSPPLQLQYPHAVAEAAVLSRDSDTKCQCPASPGGQVWPSAQRQRYPPSVIHKLRGRLEEDTLPDGAYRVSNDRRHSLESGYSSPASSSGRSESAQRTPELLESSGEDNYTSRAITRVSDAAECQVGQEREGSRRSSHIRSGGGGCTKSGQIASDRKALESPTENAAIPFDLPPVSRPQLSVALKPKPKADVASSAVSPPHHSPGVDRSTESGNKEGLRGRFSWFVKNSSNQLRASKRLKKSTGIKQRAPPLGSQTAADGPGKFDHLVGRGGYLDIDVASATSTLSRSAKLSARRSNRNGEASNAGAEVTEQEVCYSVSKALRQLQAEAGDALDKESSYKKVVRQQSNGETIMDALFQRQQRPRNGTVLLPDPILVPIQSFLDREEDEMNAGLEAAEPPSGSSSAEHSPTVSADGSERRTMRAARLLVMFDYTARLGDELSVRTGDVLYAFVGRCNGGRVQVHAPRTRSKGYVPIAVTLPYEVLLDGTMITSL